MINAIIIVLFSGFFHALWNVCTKKSYNKIAFLFSVQVLSFIVFAPIFLPKLFQINFISKAGLLFVLSMMALTKSMDSVNVLFIFQLPATIFFLFIVNSLLPSDLKPRKGCPQIYLLSQI